MGNSKSKPGIHIQTQKSIYMPGQIVQGCIYINAPQPYQTSKIVLSVMGFERTWWKASQVQRQRQGQGQGQGQGVNVNGSIGSNQSLRSGASGSNGVRPNQVKIQIAEDRMGQCKVIQTYFLLNNWGNTNTLHGQYAFPFQFQLPSYIPGSFRQQTPTYKATIIYDIRIQLTSAKKPTDDILIAQQLIIRQPKKLSEESLYGQVYLQPQSCCCCSKNGVSRICCYFQKNQYKPGEQCIAICEADNYKCNLDVKRIQVKFKKVVTLTSGFGEQKTFIQEINQASFPGIKAHDQYTGEQAKKISIPLQYKTSDTPIHPTTNGRFVKCHYYLQVTPQYSGCCTKKNSIKSFQVNLNIQQEANPILKIQQPDNWNPEICKKSQIVINQNFSNEFIDSMGNKNYF